MNNRIQYCRAKEEEYNAQTTAHIIGFWLRANRFSVTETAAIALVLMVLVEAITETAMAHGPFLLYTDANVSDDELFEV